MTSVKTKGREPKKKKGWMREGKTRERNGDKKDEKRKKTKRRYRMEKRRKSGISPACQTWESAKVTRQVESKGTTPVGVEEREKNVRRWKKNVRR